ncbi:hypothetical protein [Caenimonas sp. SL110]|uniref:hypothetical protein n=1 Tax=Caenimonas sp. SL110 TaxID=1450524 RepID=UPI000654A431|nr:hypothetical protein [Caenimonas sp. SL110]
MKITSFVKAAAVALVVAGAAGAANARSNVYFSIGANIAPGVVIGASNGYYPPTYSSYVQPVYSVPAPTYYAPTYYAPTYYEPTYYVRPAPVVYAPRYYSRPHRHVRYYGHGYRY